MKDLPARLDALIDDGWLDARIEGQDAGTPRLVAGERYFVDQVRFEGDGAPPIVLPAGPLPYSHATRLRIRERAMELCDAEVELLPSFRRDVQRVDLQVRPASGGAP